MITGIFFLIYSIPIAFSSNNSVLRNNNITQVEIDEQNSFYFMREMNGDGIYVNYSQDGVSNFLTVEDHSWFLPVTTFFEITITNEDTGTHYFISDIPENKYVSVNSYEAIGELELDQGTYSFDISSQSSNTSGMTFKLVQTNLILGILGFVFSILFSIFGLIGFFTFRTIYKRLVVNETTAQYQSYNATQSSYDYDKNPYDEDDPFAKYDQ